MINVADREMSIQMWQPKGEKFHDSRRQERRWMIPALDGISDGCKSIGIAGIMGGEESHDHDDVKIPLSRQLALTGKPISVSPAK